MSEETVQDFMSPGLKQAIEAIKAREPAFYQVDEPAVEPVVKPAVDNKPAPSTDVKPEEIKDTPAGTPEVIKPSPDKNPALEKSWAKVMEIEKTNVSLKQEIKALQAKAEEAAILQSQLAELKEVQEFLTKFHQDPYQYLESMNIDMDTWQARKANNYQPTVEERVARVEQMTTAQAEAAERAEQARAYNEYKALVSESISAMSLDAETSKHVSLESVLELVTTHFQSTGGEILDAEDAVKAMLETYKASIPPAPEQSKVDPGQGSSKDNQDAIKPKTEPATQQKPASNRPDPKTLTNKLDTGASQLTDDEDISDAALMAKAVKRLRGTL